VNAGGYVFVIFSALAIISMFAGIVLAFSKRPNGKGEAVLVGIGLPIVFAMIAFAGCGAAFKGL